MNLTYLGDNIADLRKKLGLKQEELADKLNVSRQAVSKWERNESYPETENLIALSKLFGVSIDALINENIESVHATNCVNTAEEQTDAKQSNYNDEPNASADIAKDGDELNAEEKDDGVELTDLNDDHENDKKWKFSFWMSLPYPLIVTIIFITWGFLHDSGFSVGWTLYITIPVYYTLLTAIKTRRLVSFCYPALTAFLYCLFGMLFDIWHPLWVIFITIPLYYAIAPFIDRAIRKK